DARRRHHEEGILHVMRVRRAPLAVGVALLAERLDERKDLVAHRLEHLLGSGLLEARPAELVLGLGEYWLLDALPRPRRLALLQRVQLVEPFDEQKIRQLLDDRERVRNPAGPHRVPDAIDLGSEVTGDHAFPLMLVRDAPPSFPIPGRGVKLYFGRR